MTNETNETNETTTIRTHCSNDHIVIIDLSVDEPTYCPECDEDMELI